MIIIMDIIIMDIIIVINIFLHMATRIAYQMEMPIHQRGDPTVETHTT